MAVKRCEKCGFSDGIGGCKLMSSNCVNTATRPSFMKAEDMNNVPRKIVPEPMAHNHILARVQKNKEDRDESFGTEKTTLRTRKEYGPVNRRYESSIN